MTFEKWLSFATFCMLSLFCLSELRDAQKELKQEQAVSITWSCTASPEEAKQSVTVYDFQFEDDAKFDAMHKCAKLVEYKEKCVIQKCDNDAVRYTTTENNN